MIISYLKWIIFVFKSTRVFFFEHWNGSKLICWVSLIHLLKILFFSSTHQKCIKVIFWKSFHSGSKLFLSKSSNFLPQNIKMDQNPSFLVRLLLGIENRNSRSGTHNFDNVKTYCLLPDNINIILPLLKLQ